MMKYNEDYHNGRQACRDKYVKSGLLVINPDIDIDALCESPCRDCEHHRDALKMPCLNVTTCKRKQNQLTAIEIKQYFKRYEQNTVE